MAYGSRIGSIRSLTDVPIGAWTTARSLGVCEVPTGDEAYGRAADFAVGVGLVGAAGAAVTGLNDWSETEGRSRRLGLLHGLLNLTATALVTTSNVLRRNGSRAAGRRAALVGYGIATAPHTLAAASCTETELASPTLQLQSLNNRYGT